MPGRFIHSSACIVDSEAHILGCGARTEYPSLRIADPCAARLETEHAALRHRVAGIVDQVQEDLLDRMAVGRDLRQIFVREHEQLDVRWQDAPQHGREIVHQRPEMHGLERQGRPAREAEQLIHHEPATHCGRHDVPQTRLVRAAREQLGVGEDNREEIVEVMCDAARELTDRFHFLGLAQLLFQATAFAHVFGEYFMALHPAVLESHGPSIESHRDCFAVLAAPAGLRFRRRSGLVQLRDVTATGGRILEHIAIEVALEQRGLRPIPQHLDECRVD